MEFNGKILIIGYGSIARCTLPMLIRHVGIPCRNITVVDFVDAADSLQPWTMQGVQFVRERIAPLNLQQTLSRHAAHGGMVMDLSWNVDTVEMLQWCHEHGVLYLNTSLEEWDPHSDMRSRTPFEKSLYARHMRLRKATAAWSRSSATAVLDHGANPGLVSHFVRQGLVDVAQRKLAAPAASREEKRRMERLLAERDFARLAMRLGVKVIHCSELDAQRTSVPKEEDEFVGTWSIEGLREECMSPAEIGWGTHEVPPSVAAVQPEFGPRNQIFLCQMGMNTWVRSWVPHKEIVGMAIRHGEAFTVSDSLSVRENEECIYRPTVHYAYLPCSETMSSLHELRCRNYRLQPKLRIMSDEIVGGSNMLGALLMGDCGAWWTGSILEIEASRRLVPGQNATTVQVAAGLVAAALWMMKNPQRGLCVPDDLPYDDILGMARPFLGEFLSIPTEWTPFSDHRVFFPENAGSQLNCSNKWSFENFLFRS